MTATTVERLPKFAGQFPAHGTYPAAANTLILKGTFVARDSAGRASIPAAGCPIVGVAEATFLNRTTDASGGAAGAIDVEVSYGVYGFLVTGTTPIPGQVVYAADNQTVTLDPSSSKGVAGVVTEVRDSLAYVYVSPVQSATFSPLVVDVPLGSFRLASGAAVPAFANGSADGFNLADSEALGIRINDDSTTVFWASVRLPESLPTGAAVQLHVLASRIGALDVTASLTPTVFPNREGVAYDAGSSLVTGDFAAITGATKVVQELSKTITGALAGDVLSISLVATAALDDDDAVIHGVWITCA